MIYIDFETLKIKTKELLLKNGANQFSAESVAIGLSETSLRGVDSHGIRLLPHYINALKNGRINGNPKFKVINTFPSFIGLDGDNGFGHAFWTIIDANITTALAGVCLLNFGTGPIKGFAVTLLIGIFATVYTSYFVGKLLFEFYMNKVEGQDLSI